MMNMTQEDLDAWEAFIKSVKPLDKKTDLTTVELPRRLRVKARPERILTHIIDLHGLTLQEAYTCVLKFVTIHFTMGTKHISIITGKGLHDDGKIKKEMPLWLDTPVFKDKIASYEWVNAGGTVRINLKRSKRKKNA